MSEGLDLIHLIDAKVRAVRAKADRSRVVAILAKEHLDQHRRWFDRHLTLSSEAMERRQRGLTRQRAAEARRKRAKNTGLRVRFTCVWLLRGAVSDLAFVGAHLWFGLAWIIAKGLVLRAPLGKRLAAGVSWLAAKARAVALSSAESLERTASRLLRRLNFLGQSLIRSGRHAGEALEKRRRDAGRVRLRIEHARLQSKIHALGKARRPRRVDGMRQIEQDQAAQQPQQEEWAELRQLARKARRGVEMQDCDRRGAVAWRGNGRASRMSGSTVWARSHGTPQARSAAPPAESSPAGKADGRVDTEFQGQVTRAPPAQSFDAAVNVGTRRMPPLNGLADVSGIEDVSHRLR